MGNILSDGFDWREYRVQIGIISVFAGLMFIFLTFASGVFTSEGIYTSILAYLPVTGLLAIGLSFVVTTSEIDLSFAGVFLVSGWTFAWVVNTTGNPLLAFIAAIIVGVMFESINALIITKFNLDSLLVTLGMMFALQGLATVLTGGMGFNIEIGGGLFTDLMTHNILGVFPVQSLWFIIITIVAWFLLNRNTFGNDLRCVGDNSIAAREMGISIGKTKLLAFIFLGILTAFASVISATRITYYYPTARASLLFEAIASVAIGGTFFEGGRTTILGTFVGALLIRFLASGIIAIGFAGYWTQLMTGVIIVFAMIAQSLIRSG